MNQAHPSYKLKITGNYSPFNDNNFTFFTAEALRSSIESPVALRSLKRLTKIFFGLTAKGLGFGLTLHAKMTTDQIRFQVCR